MSEEMIEAGADTADDEVFVDEETTDLPDDTETDDKPEPARQAAHKEPVPDPAKKTEPEKKEPPKPARTYRLKANGREKEVPAEVLEALAREMELDDPEILLRGAGMFKAGQERAREAAELKKQAEALTAKLKTDPKAALREMLGDKQLQDLAIATVQDLMESEKLTPEQRRIRELEGEQAKVQAEKDAQAQETEEREAQAYQQHVAQRLDQEITGALETGKMPKDPYVVKRVAALMSDALDKGAEADELEVADFVPLALEEMRKEHETFLGKLSGEQIVQMFPDLAEKVRKYHVDRVKGRRAVPEQPEGATRRTAKPAASYGSVGAVLRDF